MRNIAQYHCLGYLERVQHFFLFSSILIMFKVFYEGKGMGFFKVQGNFVFVML